MFKIFVCIHLALAIFRGGGNHLFVGFLEPACAERYGTRCAPLWQEYPLDGLGSAGEGECLPLGLLRLLLLQAATVDGGGVCSGGGESPVAGSTMTACWTTSSVLWKMVSSVARLFDNLCECELQYVVNVNFILYFNLNMLCIVHFKEQIGTILKFRHDTRKVNC